MFNLDELIARVELAETVTRPAAQEREILDEIQSLRSELAEKDKRIEELEEARCQAEKFEDCPYAKNVDAMRERRIKHIEVQLAEKDKRIAALEEDIKGKVIAAYIAGYESGHNDTVESCYGGQEDQAEDYAQENLAPGKGGSDETYHSIHPR